jgi:predicted N-acetyltransferase YhbS
MVTIRQEKPCDVAARERLLDLSFGDCRFEKASERLREGRLPAVGLSFVATARGRVIGTVRLWHVALASGARALLLGPLAVDPAWRSRGIGGALMRRAIEEAQGLGHGAVLLVGDAPYYGRFGFSADKTAAMTLPGPYEAHRLLALECVPGALDGAAGMISGTGLPAAGKRRRAGDRGVRPERLPRAA